MRNRYLHSLKKFWITRWTIIVPVFAVVLTIMVAMTLASSKNLEAENGTRTGNVTSVSDTSASGSTAVKFGTSVAALRFPTPDSVGTPRNWTPTRTISTDTIIWDDGTVIENLLVDGARIQIPASNVTIRKSKFINGAGIQNTYNQWCGNGLVVEDTSFSSNGVEWLAPGLDATVEEGGYTLRRVYMDKVYEGARSGSGQACGPIVIEDSYLGIQYPPACLGSGTDWHGDGLQFYNGNHATIRNSVIWMNSDASIGCGGNGAVFWADQCYVSGVGTVPCGDSRLGSWYSNLLASHGGVSLDIDGLIVRGGGFTFRAHQPSKVQNLYIVNDSWQYGPIIADCSLVTAGWNARRATIDAQGQPIAGTAIPCE